MCPLSDDSQLKVTLLGVKLDSTGTSENLLVCRDIEGLVAVQDTL